MFLFCYETTGFTKVYWGVCIGIIEGYVEVVLPHLDYFFILGLFRVLTIVWGGGWFWTGIGGGFIWFGIGGGSGGWLAGMLEFF